MNIHDIYQVGELVLLVKETGISTRQNAPICKVTCKLGQKLAGSESVLCV